MIGITVLLPLLHTLAAANGMIVAVILMATGKRETRRLRLTLGGFLLAGSALLALFVLLDRGYLVFNRPIGVFMEVLAVGLPALYLDYVLTVLGVKRWRSALYLPVPVFAGIAAIHGDLLGSVTDFAGAVFLLAAAIVSSVIVYEHRRSVPAIGQRRSVRRLRWLIAFMIIFVTAQFVRLAFPASNWLFDLVPLIGTLGITAFVISVIMGSRTLNALVEPPLDGRRVPALEEALAEFCADRQRLTDPELNLESLSVHLQMPERKLAAYLMATRGQGFREWLKARRIEWASRLLRDRKERRTSIEAIGLMSGFASRSAFYEAFKSVHGMTPAAFRKLGPQD